MGKSPHQMEPQRRVLVSVSEAKPRSTNRTRELSWFVVALVARVVGIMPMHLRTRIGTRSRSQRPLLDGSGTVAKTGLGCYGQAPTPRRQTLNGEVVWGVASQNSCDHSQWEEILGAQDRGWRVTRRRER